MEAKRCTHNMLAVHGKLWLFDVAPADNFQVPDKWAFLWFSKKDLWKEFRSSGPLAILKIGSISFFWKKRDKKKLTLH